MSGKGAPGSETGRGLGSGGSFRAASCVVSFAVAATSAATSELVSALTTKKAPTTTVSPNTLAAPKVKDVSSSTWRRFNGCAPAGVSSLLGAIDRSTHSTFKHLSEHVLVAFVCF